MHHFGIHIADWVALAVYLVGITILGVWMARKVKDRTDFFMGGRRFGKVFMIFFSFGTGTHSDQAVGVAAKTYTAGLSGIWYQWLWLFSTPFYWLIAPIFRRTRALTTGDYFDARYDKSVSGLFAVVGVLQLMVAMGTMLIGSSAIITAVSGGAITKWEAIWTMTILFVIYGVAGGLAAAVVTDFVQGILTIVLSFMLLPSALYLVGGMSGLKEKIADPHMFTLTAPGNITVFYIIIISLNALVGIVTQPESFGMGAAGRTEMDGRVGFAFGTLIKRVCTVAWMLVGLCAIVMYPGLTGAEEINQTYGLMAKDLLPQILPGLVGVFIASLLASVMSSCDAFMISSSALFTENVYRPLMRGRSHAHYVTVGRIAAVIVVVGGLIFAASFTDVVKALETFWKVQAMMGIAFWLGLFWARTSAAGAWAATLGGFGTLLLTMWAPVIRLLGGISDDFVTTEVVKGVEVTNMSLPWQMIFYLVTGTVLGIAVSLLTKPVAAEKLEKFYGCLRTPVSEEEPHTDEPFQLPPGVTPAPENYATTAFGLRIPWPSRLSAIGFVGLCIVVYLMIRAVYWIAALGGPVPTG